MNELVILVVVALVAAFIGGYYAGQREVQAAWIASLQHVAETGRYQPFTATVIPPAEEPEDRIVRGEPPAETVSEEAIERGAAELLRLAKAASYPLTETEARAHAETMLAGHAPL